MTSYGWKPQILRRPHPGGPENHAVSAARSGNAAAGTVAKVLSDCGHATSLVAFRHLGHSAGNLKPLKDCPLFTVLRAFRHTQHVRNTHAT